MFKGIAFALGACFIWGLIFVVPLFMEEFSAMEITLGRFLVYGLISTLFFCKSRLQGLCKYPLHIWSKALYFSLVMTIGYYTLLVLALRFCTPAVCALIIGMSPIAIAFYGNLLEKEVPFKSLILPSAFIFLGLVLINVPHFELHSHSHYILGLLCSFLALGAWSWFVVVNSRFLKQNPSVQSNHWATLIGVSSLVWAILLGVVMALFLEFQIEKYFTLSPSLMRFVMGSAILGILCSWIGGYFWNKASLYLPVALAGQMTIFETIFGVVFIYLLKQQLPPLTESVGIAILLSAIVYGIREFTKKAMTSSASH